MPNVNKEKKSLFTCNKTLKIKQKSENMKICKKKIVFRITYKESKNTQ
jgi:RNase P/RNase MRP subunit p29